MIWSILRIIIVVYVAFGVILYLFQKRFIYRPSAAIENTPEAAGLKYEDVTLTTSDGVKISAWYVPADDARGTVLFCHGNAGNVSHRLMDLVQFNDLGLNVLIFDYRGYGASEGSPSEKGTYRDAEAAWEHLLDRRGEKPGRIVVFGRSLGGAVAAWLAVEKTPAGLILESTFTSIPDMARKMYPVYPIRLLARVHYDTLSHVRQLKCPVLVLHSRDDDMIPFEHGKKLHEAAPQPKEFLEMRGGHNSPHMDHPDDYANAVGGFITRHLPK